MPKLTEDMFEVPARGCKLGQLLEDLDEKSRAVLEAALANPDIGGAYIHDRLKDAGFEDPPRETCIRKHRDNKCRCPS